MTSRAERVRASAAMVVPELLSAGMFILPLLFIYALGDAFALPKTVAVLAISFLLVIALAIMATAQGALRLDRLSGTTKALIVYMALLVLATVRSPDLLQSIRGEDLQYQGLLASTGYAVAYIAAASSLAMPNRVRGVLGAAVGAAFLVAVYGILQQAGFDPVFGGLYNGFIFSTLGQHTNLAAYLVLALPLALAFAAVGPNWRRFAAGIAAATIGLTLALTFSRGGYLGIVVALLVFLACIVRQSNLTGRRVGVVAVLTLALAALVFVVPPTSQLVARVVERAVMTTDTTEGSAATHLALWSVGAHIAADNPLLGVGPEIFPEVFPSYRDRVLSPAVATSLAGFRVESPHDVPLAIADGAGIPSLAAYLLVVVGAIRAGVRRLSTSSRAERVLLAGVLGAVAGHFVTDLFMTAEVTGSWMFWALLGTLTATGTVRVTSS